MPHSHRPYPAVIQFRLEDPAETGEALLPLAELLYREGYILDSPRELRRVLDHLQLICVFVDVNASRTWTKSQVIHDAYASVFSSQLMQAPVVRPGRSVVLDVQRPRNCTCKHSAVLFLRERLEGALPPVRCGDCYGVVPSRKLPQGPRLEAWAKTTARLWGLVRDDVLDTQWAAKQLAEPSSGLYREGRALANGIVETLRTPAYCVLGTECERPTPQRPSVRCPLCGGESADLGVDWTSGVCLRCKLAW